MQVLSNYASDKPVKSFSYSLASLGVLIDNGSMRQNYYAIYFF